MRDKLLVVCFCLLAAACSKKSDNGNNPPPVLPAVPALISPAQNQACTTGTIVSDTQSIITFTWDAAAHADSYEVDVKNLLTSDSTIQTTTALQLTLTLARNTPYSWFVVSKSSGASANEKSAVWKFYNPGPGIVTYAPYPAEIVSPAAGEILTASTVNLTWEGSTVNNTNTIANYDVYFGTTSSPAILKSAITDSFINAVPVSAGTTYYWKVITRDVNGNTSDSGLYQFTVN